MIYTGRNFKDGLGYGWFNSWSNSVQKERLDEQLVSDTIQGPIEMDFLFFYIYFLRNASDGFLLDKVPVYQLLYSEC